MKSARVAVIGLLFGCGPLVAVGGESDGESDGETESRTDSGSDDAGSSTGVDTLPPGTVGDEVSGVPPDPSIGDDFPSAGECWHVEPLFDAPDHVAVIPDDQDGDGREEIWLFWDSDGGQGPGDTTVFAIDDIGTVLTEVLISGFVIGLGDIEGDGLADLITVSFDGEGPPYFGSAQAIGPASFTVPPAMLDLELGQNVSGFFDVSLDGPADVFRLRDDGQLELDLGNGAGTFAPGSELTVGDLGSVRTSRVDDAPSLAVLWNVEGFGGDPGCTPTNYRLLDGTGGELVALAASTSPDLGLLQSAAIDGNGQAVLYVDTCVPESTDDLHDLRQLVAAPGSAMFTEIPAAIDKAWVTIGDLDGDGLPDLVFADPDADTMSLARGNGVQTFGDTETTDVPLTDTRDNNVRTLDMDGDGRDELVRGTVIAEGSSAQLSYERIFLGPC